MPSEKSAIKAILLAALIITLTELAIVLFWNHLIDQSAMNQGFTLSTTPFKMDIPGRRGRHGGVETISLLSFVFYLVVPFIVGYVPFLGSIAKMVKNGEWTKKVEGSLEPLRGLPARIIIFICIVLLVLVTLDSSWELFRAWEFMQQGLKQPGF